jgi:hypothetical protein
VDVARDSEEASVGTARTKERGRTAVRSDGTTEIAVARCSRGHKPVVGLEAGASWAFGLHHVPVRGVQDGKLDCMRSWDRTQLFRMQRLM